MTRVVAVGYAPQAFVTDQPPYLSLSDGVQREDLEGLVSLVADDLSEGRAVLAVYPSWWAEPALRRLQTVRVALSAPRFLIYPCSLPPVAGSALCGLAAALAPLAQSPGALVAGLGTLERQLVPIAQLGSVANLRHPTPSLSQHVASWVRRSSFGISWWPQPSVHRLRSKDRGVPLPIAAAWTGAPLTSAAISVPEGASRAWFSEVVFPTLGTTSLVEVPPTPLRQRYWGTRRVVDAVAYSPDLEALRSHVFDGRYAAHCRWCGEAVSSDVCPFCGMDRGLRGVAEEAA
jgi:hypothetical protein